MSASWIFDPDERGADAGMAGCAGLEKRRNAVGYRPGEAIDGSGNAAGNGLAQHEPVGLEAVFAACSRRDRTTCNASHR